MSPRRPEVPFRAERAYACPACGTWMQVNPNPHYGVGLAVHPYICLCPNCGCPNCGWTDFGWTDFVPTAPDASMSSATRRRGFFARILNRRDRHPGK